MTAADPAVFLADVLAGPADDAPRMAYADWLQERGDPLGEFVAVQLRLARCRDGAESCPPDSRCGRCMGCELRRRERELLLTHGRAWPAGLLGLEWLAREERDGVWFTTGDAGLRLAVQFRRGFIAHVELTLAAFDAHAAALFRAAPLESVRLADREPLSHGGRSFWWASGSSFFHDQAEISRELFGLLPEAAELSGPIFGGEMAAGYSSRAAAHAALSAACVAFGRDAAGLPALPAEGAARA
jgi:uncharacterized protein (TIGR02996 family)